MNQPPLRQRSGFHISLKWLLLSVVPISCAATALRSATTAWAVAAVSLTLLAMFGSIIAAKFDVRRRRPIWMGFTVFAGGYLVVLFGAPRDIVEAFGTEKLNRLLIASCHPAVDYPVEQMILMRTAPADERPARVAKSAIYMALFGLLDDQPATSDSTNSRAAAADTATDTDRSANDVFSGNAIAPNGPTPTNPFADEDRKLRYRGELQGDRALRLGMDFRLVWRMLGKLPCNPTRNNFDRLGNRACRIGRSVDEAIAQEPLGRQL